MFKSPKELKNFIIWAKNNKIKRVKVGDIEVEISDLAFIEDQLPLGSQINTPVSPSQGEQDEKEEQELLYWSSGN